MSIARSLPFAVVSDWERGLPNPCMQTPCMQTSSDADLSGCKPPPGCRPPTLDADPPVNRMTHRCKTLPCPKLRLRAVITEKNDIIKVLFSKSLSFSLIPPITGMSCYAFPGGCFVLTSETAVPCTLHMDLLEYFLLLVSWHYEHCGNPNMLRL